MCQHEASGPGADDPNLRAYHSAYFATSKKRRGYADWLASAHTTDARVKGDGPFMAKGEERGGLPSDRGISRRRFIGAGAAASASLAAVMGPYAVANGQAASNGQVLATSDAAAQAQGTQPQGYIFFNTFQAD